MTPPEYAERTAAARRRLAELLDPQTDQELHLVTWLGDKLDLQWLTVLAELVEYRIER
ncbi:MAG: hypothetical protein ACRDWI_04245 [Jiangellaceae bacterium]